MGQELAPLVCTLIYLTVMSQLQCRQINRIAPINFHLKLAFPNRCRLWARMWQRKYLLCHLDRILMERTRICMRKCSRRKTIHLHQSNRFPYLPTTTRRHVNSLFHRRRASRYFPVNGEKRERNSRHVPIISMKAVATVYHQRTFLI
ncbi:unnamed protein product [Leptidea sinapis]|uniref:Uncharacterized protein n=1 Tax=Leptidea sinapis TaxID=189913 RepID=A0A5E4PMS3_9NEOP|nr:unnamed protein product [Leptidea sinapis]